MEWRDVIGYEGLYEVSNYGEVYSKARDGTKGGLLKGEIIKGYRRVNLYKKNIIKKRLVHRLVAETFIKKVEEKEMINHKDGVKLNNYVCNLEWCTRSENQLHAFKLGLQKANMTEAHKVAWKNIKVKVAKLDDEGNQLKVYGSILEAKRDVGLSEKSSAISKVARGKRKRAGGYKWKYI